MTGVVRARGMPAVQVTSARSASTAIPTARRYLPLFAWILFSAGTVYLYADGPYVFDHASSPLLYGYLAAVHVAIISGYAAGQQRYRNYSSSTVSVERARAVVKWLAFIAIPGILISLVSNAGAGQTLEASTADPDMARKVWMARGGSLPMYAVVTLSIANYPLIATTVAYWAKLTRWGRLPGIAVILAIVVSAIQGGSRSGIYAVIAVTATCLIAGVYNGQVKLRLRSVAAIFAALGLGFLLYSGFITMNRTINPIQDYGEFLRSQREMPVDRRHYAFDLFPKPLEPAILAGYFYFGHGYEGLALALEKPFVGVGLGAGHSSFLVRNAVRISGDEEIYKFSYFDRMIREDGFSPSLWITIYPWIASDLTFPGSVLFMGFLAWLLAGAWNDLLLGRSITAAWVVTWIAYTVASTTVIFPPGDFGTLLSYWGSFACWLVYRRGGRPHGARTARSKFSASLVARAGGR